MLDALRVHLLFKEAECAVEEQDVQDFVSSFQLIFCQQGALLLGHVFEAVDGSCVDRSRI